MGGDGRETKYSNKVGVMGGKRFQVKYPTSIGITPMLKRQLKNLQKWWGTANRSATITVAIDRAWVDEANKRGKDE